MNEQRLSEILYRHDPANTGCNVCEDMEDEYDRIAMSLARIPAPELSFDAFRLVLVDAFFKDALRPEAMQCSYAEIRSLGDPETDGITPLE